MAHFFAEIVWINRGTRESRIALNFWCADTDMVESDVSAYPYYTIQAEYWLVQYEDPFLIL